MAQTNSFRSLIRQLQVGVPYLQLARLSEQTPVNTVVTLALVVLIPAFVLVQVWLPWMLVWAVAQTGLILAVYIRWRKSLRPGASVSDSSKASTRSGLYHAVIWAALSGSLWGSLTFFLPGVPPHIQLALILTMGGMAAGASATLSAVSQVAIVYILGCCLPVTIYHLTMGNQEGMLLALVFAIFMVAMLGTSQVVHFALARQMWAEQYARQLREAGLQQRVATMVNEAASRDEAFQSCLDEVCNYTGWPAGHVYLLADDGSNELESSRVWYVENENRFKDLRRQTEKARFGSGEGLPGRVLERGEPLWKADGVHAEDLPLTVADAIAIKEFPRARAVRDAGIKAIFGLPVSVGLETMVVLEFFSEQTTRPSDQLMELLGAIALQLGCSIERRQADRSIRRSEEQYRLLLESTAEAIYGIDLEGNCTFVNPACVQMLGYQDQSDLIGKNMHTLMHHTRADGFEYPTNECEIYKAFRAGGGSHVDDEVLWRADGSSFPAEYWSHPISRSGEVLGSVVTFLDITARRQAEDSVRREEARLSAILGLAMNAVVCVDEEQRITVFNSSAEAVFGYSADEVLGEHIGMLLPESLRSVHQKQIAAFSQLDQPRRMASKRPYVIGLRKDGSEFPAEASVSMIDVDGEKIITATLVDLTEKHQNDKKLQQAQKMEAVGQLTSGIAHDFNNMLAIVMGNLELAEEAGKTNGDVRDYLSAAMQGAQRGADLNRQLLTFSRQQVLQDQITNVSDIVRGMSGLLKRSLGEEIEIETILGVQDCTSEVDPAQLESAILNLAINARDAMPQGGKLRIGTGFRFPDENTNAANTAKEMVRISVSDDGSGMTEEVKDHALEPFYTTKKVGSGSGLGLSMVHGFVTQAGGELEINSEVGTGTTIHMLFPVAIADDDVSDDSVGSEVPRATNGETILVVEDQRDVRDVIVAYLGDLGYQLLEAEDGNSAVKILESFSSIDLVLTDLVLPGGMRGEEVVKQAKRILPNLAVLYMSGNPLRSANSSSSCETPAPMIQKPFSKATLAQAVCVCLDKVR